MQQPSPHKIKRKPITQAQQQSPSRTSRTSQPHFYSPRSTSPSPPPPRKPIVDPNREVAFPPSAGPKAPIRELPDRGGMTNVHLGVQPRIPGQQEELSSGLNTRGRLEGPRERRSRIVDKELPDPNNTDERRRVQARGPLELQNGDLRRASRWEDDTEVIDGVGIGHGPRSKLSPAAPAANRRAAPPAPATSVFSSSTEFSETSSQADSRSAPTLTGRTPSHDGYVPKPARPTLSIAEQAEQYDREYQARLNRMGLTERDFAAKDSRSKKKNDMEQDDDPRMEGVYTFDYTPNPTNAKHGSNQNTTISKTLRSTAKHAERIVPYQDPTRPGIQMKARKYLPVPVDEKSYGVPAARRVRAWLREKENEQQSSAPGGIVIDNPQGGRDEQQEMKRFKRQGRATEIDASVQVQESQQKVRKMRSEPGNMGKDSRRTVKFPLLEENFQYEPVDTLVPPMPAGEEYDPDTERERQEAWRAYYAAMTTYEGNSPAMGVGLGLESVPNAAMLASQWNDPSVAIHNYPRMASPYGRTQGQDRATGHVTPDERRSERRSKSRDPSKKRPGIHQKRSKSSFYDEGVQTPASEILPTPMYPAYGQAENYFGYYPHPIDQGMQAVQTPPYGHNMAPIGYNAAADPFAMSDMSAALYDPRVAHTQKSWYAGGG